MTSRTITYNIASVLTNSIFAFGLAAVANLLTVRMLGPAERGAFSVAAILAMTLMIIVDGGMRSAVLYNVSAIETKEEALREGGAVCANTFVVAAAAAAVLYTAVFLVGQSTFLKGVPLHLLIISFFYCLAALLNDLVVILFMSIRDFASRNVVSLIAPLSCCAVTVVWFFAFHEISAPQALTILASSVAIACASGVYRLVRVHRFPLSVAMPRDWKSRYLRFGAKSLFAQLALQGSARLDVFILNMLLGRTAVGYYSAGVSLAELGQQTTNAISTVIYPEIVKRSGADRKRVTVLTVGSAVYVIAVVSAVLAILTPWLLPFLFGAKYSPAVEAAMWLLPGMVGMTLFRMMGTVTAANGRPEDRTYAACVGLAFTVILDLLFIPTKGIVGAAQASSISYILMGITLAWLYVRAQKVDLGRFTMDLIRQPIIAAAARLRTDSSGRPIS